MDWKRLLPILFTLLLINIYKVDAKLSRTRYVKISDCISDLNCSKLDMGLSRSQVECAAYCGKDELCPGFLYTSGNMSCTCLQGDCFSASTCEQNDIVDVKLFKKKPFCQHGGIFNVTLKTCSCSFGWVGDHCERRPYSCEELKTYGYPENTYEWMKIDVFRNGSRLVNTRCFFSGPITRTYILRSEGRKDVHHRPWSDYLQGYTNELYDLNFWLGLENIRAFNRQGYTKVTTVVLLSNTDGDIRLFVQRNTNFHIGDADVGYSFECDPCSAQEFGTLAPDYHLEDLLFRSQGLPFSTYDNDNDLDVEINCAEVAHAGWWFRNYSTMDINPLGPRYQTGDVRQYLMLPGLPMTATEISNTFSMVELFFQTIT